MLNRNDVDQDKINQLVNGVEFMIILLYPIACLLVDRLGIWYQSPGYSIAGCDRLVSRVPFKDVAVSYWTNDKIKSLIEMLQIYLPGYDSKIPKVIVEYREENYDAKIKKYVQDNISKLYFLNKLF